MKKSVIESLSKCPIFKGISEENLKYIAENFATYSSCNKNEVIFSENNYTRSLVVIIKGSVAVTKNNENSQILMSILNQGDIFGMATLFYEEDEYLTRITALEKVSMVVFLKENVQKIFTMYPSVTENYIKILSEKIHFLNKKITTYTRSETIQKVADFILQCANNDQTMAILPYSVTKISEALNVGRASVYRAFDSLENNNVIKRDDKLITILNLSALKNI